MEEWFLRDASILTVDAYSTPLGDIPVDTEVTAELLKNELFRTQAAAHAGEHSLENELPFLQRALGDGWKLVPILIGRPDPAQTELSDKSMKTYAAIADAIRPFIDDQTLVVASSDWTHYGARFGYYPFGPKASKNSELKEKLKKLDLGSAQPVLERDAEAFRQQVNARDITICGRWPICVLLYLMPETATGHLAKYYTSGDLTGDYSSSVSYVSVVFTVPPTEKIEAGEISRAGQKRLLQIARETLEASLDGKAVPTFKDITPELKLERGTFVTLNKNERLRGCIGCFTSTDPLYRTVSKYAVISATQDHRFQPVRPDELKNIKIEISVLSPMRRVRDPLKEIEIGKHGIYIKRGFRAGTFLPQVATEHKMTKEQFLSLCCSQKARLPADAWKDPDTEVYVYTAQIFHEE